MDGIAVIIHHENHHGVFLRTETLLRFLSLAPTECLGLPLVGGGWRREIHEYHEDEDFIFHWRLFHFFAKGDAWV